MVLASQPGGLGQPLGGPAGRGAQSTTAHLLGPEDLDDGIDEGRLAHARTTGDDQHLG